MFSSTSVNGLIAASLLLVTWSVSVAETQVMHTDQTPPVSAGEEREQVALPRAPQASNIASALQHIVYCMWRDGVTATNVALRQPETYTTPLVRVDPLGRLHTAILVHAFDSEAEAALAVQQVQLDKVDILSRVVQAWIPFDHLDTVAALPFVRYLRPPSYAHRR